MFGKQHVARYRTIIDRLVRRHVVVLHHQLGQAVVVQYVLFDRNIVRVVHVYPVSGAVCHRVARHFYLPGIVIDVNAVHISLVGVVRAARCANTVQNDIARYHPARVLRRVRPVVPGIDTAAVVLDKGKVADHVVLDRYVVAAKV